MGMRSWLDDQDIEMKNFEGFKEMVQNFARVVKRDYFLEAIDEKNKTVDFNCFHDVKLISYWYSHQVVFFKLCAKFMEGTVTFCCEDDTLAEITFCDGEVELRVTVWEDLDFKSLSDFEYDDEIKVNKLKDLLVLYEV